jgi:hypothetical protein
MSASPSRRRLLQAALLTPLAACTTTAGRPARVDPDVALRAAAVARERSLLALYDAAPPSATVLAIRAEHEQHLAALGAPSPAPSPATAATGSLVAAERAAAAAHAADALVASPQLAAVLASLAASEASHPVALA